MSISIFFILVSIFVIFVAISVMSVAIFIMSVLISVIVVSIFVIYLNITESQYFSVMVSSKIHKTKINLCHSRFNFCHLPKHNRKSILLRYGLF